MNESNGVGEVGGFWGRNGVLLWRVWGVVKWSGAGRKARPAWGLCQILLVGLCGAEGLEQLEDGGGCTDAVVDGGGIDAEAGEVVHGADDALNIGSGDEASAGGDHSSGKRLLVGVVVFV